MIINNLFIRSFVCAILLTACNNAKTKNNTSEIIEQQSIELEGFGSDRIIAPIFSDQKEKKATGPPKELRPDTLKQKKSSTLIINKTSV